MHFYLGFFPNQKRCYACVLTSAVVYCENTCSSSTEYYYNKCQHEYTHKADRDIQPEQIAKIGNNKELNSHFRFDT